MPRAKKSLGQNFLTSRTIARDIVRAAELNKEDTVLEIGPGKGMLTAELLTSGARVIAVEKDPRMTAHLEERFADKIASGQLRIRTGDILETNLADDKLTGGSYTLVGNIPYYITGQIIRWALSGSLQPKRIVMMVQKEVADRIIARDHKESILSLSVKAYGIPLYVKKVSARYFSPAPKVDSAVITIKDISRSFFKNKKEEDRFFMLIKTAFAKKRKQIGGTLRASEGTSYTKACVRSCAIDLTARPEDITLAQWNCMMRTRAS